MTILYKETKDERFDTKVEYMLEIDTSKKEIEWIIYPHAPKDMHFKAADQYGMGSKHHNGIQSYEDFEHQPKYEIDKMIKDIVVVLLDESVDDKTKAERIKLKASSLGIELKRISNYFTNYHFILGQQLLFRVTDLKKEEIERMDLLLTELTV